MAMFWNLTSERREDTTRVIGEAEHGGVVGRQAFRSHWAQPRQQ